MKFLLPIALLFISILSVEAKTKPIPTPTPVPVVAVSEQEQVYWNQLYTKIGDLETIHTNQQSQIKDLGTQNTKLISDNVAQVKATEEAKAESLAKDKIIDTQANTIKEQKESIQHHKTFARQIALVFAVVVLLGLLVIGFQFGGLLPPPYSSYLIPIVIGVSLAGAYMVYTLITVYASHIA